MANGDWRRIGELKQLPEADCNAEQDKGGGKRSRFLKICCYIMVKQNMKQKGGKYG